MDEDDKRSGFLPNSRNMVTYLKTQTTNMPLYIKLKRHRDLLFILSV